MDNVAEAQLGVRAAKCDSEVGAQTQWPIDLYWLHSLVVLTDCAQQAWQAKCLSKTDQVIIQSCVTNQSGYGPNTCQSKHQSGDYPKTCHVPVNQLSKGGVTAHHATNRSPIALAPGGMSLFC